MSVVARRVARATGPGARRRWASRTAALSVMGLALIAGFSASGRDDALSTPALGTRSAWTPIFSDDFTGDALDTSRWQPSRYGSGAGDAPFNPDLEDAWFSPSNVSVSGGQLVLEVAPDQRTVDGETYRYRSGVVQSAVPLTLRPGTYLEARIQVPRCDGCWPAFWAVPPRSWPPEIDVMEYFDSGQDLRPSFNVIDASGGKSGPAEYGDPSRDHREGFHVYGLLWTGSSLIPYLDGQPYQAVSAQLDASSLDVLVILNLSVGRGGDPGEGARMRVDWVRAWQVE